MIIFGIIFGCSSENGISAIKIQDPVPSDTGEVEVEVLPPQIDEVVEECPDRIWSATDVSINEACQIEHEPVPFGYTVEWDMDSFVEFPEYVRLLMTPVVGHLNDDNNDGVLGAGDVPDIVVVNYDSTVGIYNSINHGVIRLISGDGSQVFWSKRSWEWEGSAYSMISLATPALGDIDNDGLPDIVTVVAPGLDNISLHDNICSVVALDPLDGSVRWVSEYANLSCRPHAAALSDMEGDGTVEIIIGNTIINGEDGSLQAQGEYGSAIESSYWTGGYSFGADLDGDGIQELISGSSIYDHTGVHLCQTGGDDGWPAVADVNGDGMGELIVTGYNDIAIFNNRCDLIHWWALEDDGRGGPLTIADYDGDGQPEIGIASADYYLVYETDGSLLWKNSVTDNSSNCTGSSVYDFEGDGYAEVVYGDEQDVWVYSGVDGSILLRYTAHESGTANEYPITIDVDGDDQVEIVVPHDHGIYVLGGLNEDWVPARQVWNQHTYHISNINDDLTIPSPTPNNWPEWNNFRSGDVRVNNGAGANQVDAVPVLVDTCEIECEQGIVQVVFQLGNQGLADIPIGAPISIYAEENGIRSLLHTINTESIVFSGRSSPGVALTLETSTIPEGKLWIVVDDDGSGLGVLDECVETNNELLIETGLCQ